MNMQSLHTLVRVAERGSFTAVAAGSNMTLSAVSAQMKGLERELGVALFDRRMRPPRLTPMGRAVTEHARRLLAERDALVATCAEPGVLAGHYWLGLIQSAYVRLLPRFIALAAREAPAARFAFALGTSRDLAERVESGALDAAVLTARGAFTGLDVHLLREEPMAFAVPLGDAPLSDAPPGDGPIPMADIHARRTFFHFMPSTGIGALVAEHLRRENIVPARVVVLDSLEAAVACTAQGAGYTLLPVSDLDRYGAERIAQVPVASSQMVRRLACIAPPGPAGERLAALFAACLEKA